MFSFHQHILTPSDLLRAKLQIRRVKYIQGVNYVWNIFFNCKPYKIDKIGLRHYFLLKVMEFQKQVIFPQLVWSEGGKLSKTCQGFFCLPTYQITPFLNLSSETKFTARFLITQKLLQLQQQLFCVVIRTLFRLPIYFKKYLKSLQKYFKHTIYFQTTADCDR